MKYSESLKKNINFKEIYTNGKSKANKFLILYVKENNLGKNRVGISVSRKIGNSVVRHRVKRLIKESYRLQEEYFHIGYDLVFIARINAKDCVYKTIENAIYQLAQRHHIIERKI